MNKDAFQKHDSELLISQVSNGYVLTFPTENEEEREVIEENLNDDLEAGEKLLWRVMEFFNLRGITYDKERLWVKRMPGEDYFEEGEKNVREQEEKQEQSKELPF